MLTELVKMLPWHDVQDSYDIGKERLTVKWKEVREDWRAGQSTRNIQWWSILIARVTMEMWNLRKVLSPGPVIVAAADAEVRPGARK